MPWLLALGAIVGVISLIVAAPPDRASTIAFYLLSLAFLVGAIAIRRSGYVFSDRSFASLLTVFTMICAYGAYTEHDPSTPAMLGLVWITMLALQFLRLDYALAIAVLTSLSAAIVYVVLAPDAHSLYSWSMLVGTIVTAAAVIVASRRRIVNLVTRLSLAAGTDWLTGLGNRREFDVRITAEVSRASRHGHPLSLVLADIDHFKTVNDIHGHATGDDLLREIAGLIREACRLEDSCYRIGGEEFAVVLADTSLAGAEVVAGRIRAAIENALRAGPLPATISLGVAELGTGSTSADDLARSADHALYAAKALGRNRVVTFDDTLAERAIESIRAGDADSRPEVRLMLALLDSLVTIGHHRTRRADRVGRWCQRAAIASGMSAGDAQRVRLAGTFSDLGKLAVPRDLLLASRPLDELELEAVREQARISADMVRALGFADVAEMVAHQYERWDGTGFPDALEGDDIPVGATIVAVATAYEAMTTDLPYATALADDEARIELQRGVGSQFSPTVVDAFLQVLEAESAAEAADEAVDDAGTDEGDGSDADLTAVAPQGLDLANAGDEPSEAPAPAS